MVWSYVPQCPGQDPGSQGGIAPAQRLFPTGQRVGGGPRAFAATHRQSDAVVLPLMQNVRHRANTILPLMGEGKIQDWAKQKAFFW